MAKRLEPAPPARAVPQGIAAVYLPLDALHPNPRNPRAHGAEVQRLARTILRTTWGAPIIAQASTRRIIGGHGRLEAARLIAAGLEVDGILRGGPEHRFDRDAPAPLLLPVRLVDVSDAEADAMTLADNARALQGNDDAAAVVAMATASFERDADVMRDMGYGAADLDALVKAAGDAVLRDAPAGDAGDIERHEIIGDAPQGEDPGAEEPPPDAPVVSRTGEVYELGPHRLVCGDSRDAATWARLMGTTKANVVFTSPPYASQRKYDESSGFKPIPPDEYVAWWEPLQACVREHLAGDGSFFVNIKEHCDDGQRHLYVKDLTIAHVRRWEWRFVDEFCWRRPAFPGGWDNRFKSEWEPVFHFTKADAKFRPANVMHAAVALGARDEGASASGSGFVKRVGGGEMARPGNVLSLDVSKDVDHPAAFPVGLPEFFIKAFSDAGDVIVDPFLGSGSTLIAATKPADGTDLDRVVLIAAAVQALIEDHAPHAVAVEPWVAVYAGKGANTTAAHALGCVLGAVRTVCAGARVRFIEGERAQGWRVALGLPRTATKAACQERVRVVLGLSRVIRPQHSSDACAVAIVAARRGLR